MEISPYMLLLLLIYSFFFGMFAGVFQNLNKALRVLFCLDGGHGKCAKLYELKVPFVGVLKRPCSDIRAKRIFLSVLIFFQDILLFALLGFGTVVLNYYLNRGQFRLYTIASVAAGFAVYYFTLGKLFSFLLEIAAFIMRASIKIILYILSRPFVPIWKKISERSTKINKNISYALAKKKIIRYNKKRSRKAVHLIKESNAAYFNRESENGT